MTKTAATISTTNGGVDTVATNLTEEQVLLLNSYLQGQPVHLAEAGINTHLTFTNNFNTTTTIHVSRLAGIHLN